MAAYWVVPLVMQAKDGTSWEHGVALMRKRVEDRYGEKAANSAEDSRKLSEVAREALAELGPSAIAKAWLTGAMINLGAPVATIFPPLMKVCQLCAVDFTLKHFLLPLVDGMRAQGWRVTAVCSDGPLIGAMRAAGYTIETLPIARSMNPLLALRSLAALTRLFRRERFDVLHAHTPVAALIGRVAARLAGDSAGCLYGARLSTFMTRCRAGSGRCSSRWSAWAAGLPICCFPRAPRMPKMRCVSALHRANGCWRSATVSRWLASIRQKSALVTRRETRWGFRVTHLSSA
jgi:hypothetical protein